MAPQQKTAALKVPILPHNSPEASQPPGMKLPLHPHQLRALHRCLLIESDGSLSCNFGARYDFRSRGGCLADAVGTGKTATSIGLILSSDKSNLQGGDTLIVAPGHLIPQWKQEIEKFTDQIEVLVGRKEYESKGTLAPEKPHRVVLVDVDQILKEKRLWYDFRRVFADEGGPQRMFDHQTMETYKKAALFCVQSPKGPCSYTGYVYTGKLHIPFRPWRRVIFDEIQDLVSEGTESQKNLLQLSRTAKNVWLLSATPFPHGNKSVYANHELLGFCRLRLDVEVNSPLPHHHPFENIKRKLYIRSPKHVADEAVTASQQVTKETVYFDATELERRFFQLEMNDIAASDRDDIFGEHYNSLRQIMVHPEASKKLREQLNGTDDQQGAAQKNKRVGRFATINSFARSSMATAEKRLQELKYTTIPDQEKDVQNTKNSWHVALKIRQERLKPVANGIFGQQNDTAQESLANRELKEIHSYFCRCPSYGCSSCIADSKAFFRTMGFEGQQRVLISGYNATQKIHNYFQTELRKGRELPRFGDALDTYITAVERGYRQRMEKLTELQKEREQLAGRIEALKGTVVVGHKKHASEDDELAARHGSKSAALIRHLQKLEESGEQTIVFSYWHDTLRLVWNSLRKCKLSASFCNGSGRAMSTAITDFTSGEVSILLLSAQAKASGANLQCATNVILLDPAGKSAEHGSTLEQQAIGRAVRMGQDKPVKVHRFCVKDSIEEKLFKQIDVAAAKLEKRSSDNSYTCEDAHKALDLEKIAAKKEEEEEFVMEESISASEKVKQNIAAAKEKGEIIVLDDSDDEEGDEIEKSAPQKKASAQHEVPVQTVPVKVKTESTSVLGKRPIGALSDVELPSTKKALESQTAENECQSISTPNKAQTDAPGRVVSPAAISPTLSSPVESAEEFSSPTTPTSPEGIETPSSIVDSKESSPTALRDLLLNCSLEKYSDKFQDAGISSLGDLKEKINDVLFMESFVTNIGMTANEAIRFQMMASQQ